MTKNGKSVGIYGASDDLVVIEVDGKGWDEKSPPKSFLFVAGAKSLYAKFSYNGKVGTTWKLAVELVDPLERGILPFDVRIVQEGHSPKLIVDNARLPVSVISGTKTLLTIDPLVAEVNRG